VDAKIKKEEEIDVKKKSEARLVGIEGYV